MLNPDSTRLNDVLSPMHGLAMKEALKQHWPEYLMEAAELGIFMVSACLFTALIWHPASPVRQSIENPMLRRVLTGVAMGLTAVAIIYSPWGKRSGAHFNPSFTLTFFRLGKIEPWDAVLYIVAQFVGGVAGVMLAAVLLGSEIGHPAVNYAATVPGPQGQWVAFVAEFLIACIQMTVVLTVSNTNRLARHTGIFAAILVATYISLESPISGMSMNPARSFGSALPARLWDSLWIYFTAPPLGMLLAAQVFVWARGAGGVICAKLHHANDKRCIFRCGYKVQTSKAAEQLNSAAI
jgi:aquaporin Z